MLYVRILLVCLALLLPVTSLAANEAMKSCMKSIQIIEGVTDRPYTMVAPVRGKKGKGIVGLVTGKSAIDRAFEKMKKQACKKGADAIIRVNCSEAVVGRGSYRSNEHGGSGDSRVDTVPVCTGTAIKWK